MCACVHAFLGIEWDWYFWATLMLLLAFLGADGSHAGWWLLVASRFQRAKSDPLRWFFLFSVVCFKHCQWNTIQLDPSARAQWKNWTWFSSNWMMSKWCGSALLLEAACGAEPAGISNMILDCMITGPVFWGPVAGYQGCWIWLTLLLVCPRFMACEIIYIFIYIYLYIYTSPATSLLYIDLPVTSPFTLTSPCRSLKSCVSKCGSEPSNTNYTRQFLRIPSWEVPLHPPKMA